MSTRNARQMSVAEFHRLGYVQEVNRRFLHPLGLALSVVREADGTVRFGPIWDARDDPEGIAFVEQSAACPEGWPSTEDAAKRAYIDAEEARRRPARIAALGYWIQGEGEVPA